MAFFEGASSLPVEIDPTHNAVRVSPRPLDHALGGKVLGHYRWAEGVRNGSNSFTAVNWSSNALICAARWTDATTYAVILRVSAALTVNSVPAAQELDPVVLACIRKYTSPDTGGTNTHSFTPVGTNQAMRSTMGPSSMSFNYSGGGAAGISGGTRSIDANAIGELPLNSALVTTSGTTVGGDLYKWDQLGQHPVVLHANEGLGIFWGATAFAGSLYTFFSFEWAEVAAF